MLNSHAYIQIGVLGFILSCLPAMLYGQLDTSGLWVNIDSIEVTATRINKAWLRSSVAISDLQESDFGFSPDISLQDKIAAVPGVFSLNAHNMAQDLRVSIRGFGARARFGVRGIKLVVDGIPETTPDGQGQLDAIPLSLLSNIEVIKGPASLLYGNASGGVIAMKTLSASNANLYSQPLLTARFMYGSFGTLQAQTTYATHIGSTTLIGHGAYTQSEGYRSHSSFKQANFKVRADHRFSKYSKLTASVDYMNSPQAQDPGGLKIDETIERSAAAVNNLVYDAGESVTQLKGSAAYTYQVSPTNTFDTYGFYIKRGYEGRLPFSLNGAVSLDRDYFGQGASYTVLRKRSGAKQTVKYGYDVASQLDRRFRFDVDPDDNLRNTTVNQREIFKMVGIYVLSDWNLGDLSFNGGLRFDHNNIKIRDDFTPNDARSGEDNMTTLNPSLGFNYELPLGAAIFGSFSTGFETPTLSEYGNDPNGNPGFNRQLLPQRSVNFELGGRMEIENTLKAQLVLYQIKTRDELIPVMLDSFPGIFYINAGSTVRRGLEIEVNYQVLPELKAGVSVNHSVMEFEDYIERMQSYDGNRLPGVPQQNASLTLSYDHPIGIRIISENRYVGEMFLESANTVKESGYFLNDLTVSYAFKRDDFTLLPFISGRNLLDQAYFDNIRINAFADRFYEPAPPRHFYFGVSLKL